MKSMINFAVINDKKMADGFRLCENRRLNPDEIEFVRQEIKAIGADESIFEFNDPGHLIRTSYNPVKDKIYIGTNVFPNEQTYSSHLRDLLTVRAVIAHEYYGHRPKRDTYLKEIKLNAEIVPRWKDEVFANIDAAMNTPNLSQHERALLINEAGRRAQEEGKTFELTKDIKEILYGKWENSGDRGIIPAAKSISFVNGTSGRRDAIKRKSKRIMPKM